MLVGAISLEVEDMLEIHVSDPKLLGSDGSEASFEGTEPADEATETNQLAAESRQLLCSCPGIYRGEPPRGAISGR